MSKQKQTKGFTLIELLVVIVIVGILAVVFLPRLIGSTSSARDAKRMAAVQRLQEALQNDLEDELTLPASGCVVDAGSTTLWDNYIPTLGGELPIDPLGSKVNYFVDAAGTATAFQVDTDNVNTLCGANGNYYFYAAPTASYDYGIYTKLENTENGNATCSALAGAGNAAGIGGVPADDYDACYVVLQGA